MTTGQRSGVGCEALADPVRRRPPEALTARLRAAATAFEEDVETVAGPGQATLDHPLFGKLQLAEYVRLQVIHTHHHRQQLTAAAV